MIPATPDPKELAVLIGGGARDGQVMAVAASVRTINVPVTMMPSPKWRDEDATAPTVPWPTVAVAVYELDYDPTGHPSRDDHGRLRYVYRGMR